jgi:hypothetical protein
MIDRLYKETKHQERGEEGGYSGCGSGGWKGGLRHLTLRRRKFCRMIILHTVHIVIHNC